MTAGLPSSLPISLIGARCSGKTTCGRALATSLGLDFVDLDEALLEASGAAEGTQVGQLFEDWGQPAFRRLEARTLAGLLREPPHPGVLATGGGAILDAGSRRHLRERSRCFWLRAEPALLARRLLADGATRPSLTEAPAHEEIAAVLEQRAPLYAATAHEVLDVEELNPSQLVARIRVRLRL